MTTTEAANFLHLQVATLNGWRSDRRGPRFFKLGHAVRYRQRDLLEFIEASAVEPAGVADV